METAKPGVIVQFRIQSKYSPDTLNAKLTKTQKRLWLVEIVHNLITIRS